jgi:hypothetical protein
VSGLADYWKKKLEELNQSTKKTSSTTKTSSSDYWKTKLDELEEDEKQKAVAPVKSAAKKEEEDKPLLMKAIDKVGDFFDNSADVVGKILTGEIFKKEDKDIAPTVSTVTKDEEKDGKFNLKNAASWAGDVAMSGLASFNKGITSTADVLLGKPLQSLGWENNPVSKMADYYDDQYTAWKGERAESEAKLGGGKVLSVMGDLGEGTVAAVPNALAALMSAGASLGATTTSAGLQQAALYDSGNLLTKIGMKVTDMVKNPQYWTSFVQTYGTDYEEAKAMGASDTAALYGATISSLLNAGVEIGIDGMSGIQGLPAKVMSGNKGAFFEWIESSLSEGGEEMVQGVISNIVAKVAYDPETKVFDTKEMLTDAAMGTAVGGLLGGGQIAAMKGADAVNNAIQPHEDNKLTENEQGGVDKVVEDRVVKTENIETPTEIPTETPTEIPTETPTDPKERRLAWYNRYGEKVADVPVMEEIEPSEPSLPQLREELERVAQQAQEAMNAGDAKALTALGQRYEELNQQIRGMEADEAARVSSLEDADAPPEVDAPYQNDGVTPADPMAERDPAQVGNPKVKAYMYDNPEVKPFFQEEANRLLGELDRSEKAQTYYNGWIKQDMSYEFAQDIPEVYRTKRNASQSIVTLRDKYNLSYDDIRKGLKALIEDHGAENIVAAKKIEFEINDRLMNGYTDESGYEIPANQEYRNMLIEKQIEPYSAEMRRSFFESVGATNIAPVAEKYEAVRPRAEKQPSMKRIDGDIAPVRDTAKKGEIPGQQSMLDEGGNEEGKIAKVMVGEPEGAQKKVNGWQKFRTNILDKFSVFEDVSLKTKNRELMGKANYMLSSEARAQNMIGQGDDGVKSLNAIRTEVENAGQTERFYNYMYHRHNVDRMSLEEKARPVVEGLYAKFGHLRKGQLHAIAAKEITDKTTEKTAQSIRDAREYLQAIAAKNKPVFGDSVTAEKSRERVSFYEQTNPEFKRWADDVYTYVNHLRGLMVENGVISQETADLWAEMYPHYVPIRRLGKSGAAVNVPLDTGRTGINAPIKRAEGGNSDIMDMFDTIAQRTEQTYRAIAKNSFGVELKNTLGTTLQKSKASLDEVIDSVDAHEELLKKGENGANPTFTVFENGERVEFEITDAMYDALKPVSDGLKIVNPVANTISKVHKGVLTEYNPVFSMTNAIKDAQDILINSQHAVKTYANIPTAIKDMAKGGEWYREYVKNGGEQNTYFDGKTNTFKEEDKAWKKVVGMPLRGISWWNNKIETLPRLAEYIASRKKGASVEVAMLDAARVTTNFQAGGDVAKFIDRNGATFLNASIQGFNQQVRNVREAKANGAKGWLQLAAKVALAGLPVLFLNEALWGDDEEYEELSDYVKDSYYIVAKFDDGKFVRIPKGRAMAVIQDAFEQVKNALTGDDEVDLRNFLDLAFTNLAPNNPWDNNIIAPVVQAVKNKAWYGGDIVPTRLQDMPSAEQYDESTDSISKWLGEKTNTSPMKWNYVLNQYGGGIADMSLPYLTPEAEGDGNKLIAPLRDKFTTDAVMNNQNVTDFYDTVDELTKNANSAMATDEDILKSKYMSSVNSELSALYQQKREIQNSGLSDKKKYAAVREVQEQIDRMTAEGLNTYGNVNIDGVYATVGDRHYRLNKEGAWEKITDKQLEKQNEVTSGLGISASDYWSNKDEYDFEYEYPEKYTFFRENGISYEDYANADEDGKRAYTWAAENPEKYVVSKAVTGDLFEYRRYTGELYDIKADKDEDGESISGSAKEKKTEYINNLDLDYGQKIILYRSLYDSKADQEAYNQDIVDYLNEREDISYAEMETILKELGFEVDSDGNISW